MALGFQPSPARPTARPQSVWDYTRLADSDLLALVAEERDQVAFEEFFSRYSRSVYSLMVRQLGDAGWADDVVQEAFISVWRHARTYRPERGAVAGWLFTIARNAGYDAARRRQAQWLVDAPDRPDPGATPHDETVDSAGGSVRVRIAGTTVTLLADTPAPGYTADVRASGPAEVEVRFRMGSSGSTEHRIRLRVDSNGALQREIS